ncbi:anti-sigma factor [Mycobacterium sp. 1164966.3]|uniref:anti-sigma factor n=1 Tax=Mycobacterium sp. 1164966.3 TaxID=1856861 RepID=UPI0008025175|nr:anti-sigma factor [Mycobacterium sp. 1164966.3]OBA82783.1 anti-sigma factor [Mycobacterium sp. 1164966.3]
MTDPNESELLDLATPYALNALTEEEKADLDRRVAASAVAAEFHDEVRAVRETMAVVSAGTAIQPPTHLRAAVLAVTEPTELEVRRQRRWRTALLAAAAAIMIGLSAFGVGVLMRPPPRQTVAEQVLTAPDVQTVSRPLGTGTATFVFSRDRNAGVLVMNNVAPPSPGTVYQMWLMGTNGPPTSAGTMGTAAVAPSTKAMVRDIGPSTALAFTVEPGAGSPQPTGTVLAQLPLS